jgi:hypothetical protein
LAEDFVPSEFAAGWTSPPLLPVPIAVEVFAAVLMFITGGNSIATGATGVFVPKPSFAGSVAPAAELPPGGVAGAGPPWKVSGAMVGGCGIEGT